MIAGKQNTHFNHNLLSVSSTHFAGTILYFEPLNLNNKKIVNLADPTGAKGAATKGYVDNKVSDEISKIPNPDLSDYLKVNGSMTGGSMTGDLNMGDNKITDLDTQDDVPITDYPNYVKDAKMAVNKVYVNENFLKLKGDDYDLKGKRILNTEPYYDGVFSTNDLVSKAYVDAEISKLPKPDLDVLKLDGSRAMTGDLKMGDNTITGIRSSTVDNAALTVGGAKSTYLPLSGDRGMQGNLNMGGNAIKNIKPFVEDDSSQAAQNAQLNDVINFGYFHAQRADLKREINVSYEALNRKNPHPMESDIDMANHSIVRLKEPQSSESDHAVNVNFVNKMVSDNNAVINALIGDKISEAEKRNIKANRQENKFSFVMDDDLFREDDDDIIKVAKVNTDAYQINKTIYIFSIKCDSSDDYYSTRLTIDLKSLDLGEYTLAFEMYYDNKVDKDEVVVNALSDTLNVSRNNTNTFSDHSRTIINFHKYGNIGIIDLDIDLTLKYKSGQSYDSTTSIFVVVYGVSGHQNDVDSRIWDRFYYIRDKIVHYEAAINMGNRQIKGLADGNEDGDAVNVKQLNELESSLTKFILDEIKKIKPT